MAETDLSKLSTDELEDRQQEMEAELDSLARLTLRSGVGNVGWISSAQKNPEQPEWAEVRIPKESRFDRIVLAPVLWLDAQKGPQADGLPTAFQIIAGQDGDTEGQVIAEMGPADQYLPRIAPLVIDVPPTRASWLRIVATELPPHSRNENRVFKLSEIMIFSGEHNIALHQPVRVSSTVAGWRQAAIYKKTLVDGLTPFLIDAATEEKGDPFLATTIRTTPFVMTIDLGTSHRIDGIRLHSALIDEYVPQMNATDFGLPKQFTLVGANQPDFSDSTMLAHYRLQSVYQAGNIQEIRFAKTACRYVRLTVPQDGWSIDTKQIRSIISLDEIEVLAAGVNVAQGAPVKFPKRLTAVHGNKDRVFHVLFTKDRLTDGKNHFGNLLTMREWTEQLARRHDLEILQPKIAEALDRKYSQQRTNLRRMYWLVAILIASIIIGFLIARILQMRAVLKVRERIAANLHDELSASLHAMVLLGDMAKKHIQSPDKLHEVVERMQKVSRRSRIAARHCANMLQSDTLCQDLVKEVKFSADRLLADIPHEVSIEGEALLHQLPRRQRNDLFLFYQECLTNIARHAEATDCTVELRGSATGVELMVTDNGNGMSATPPSLVRRARLLKARVVIETPEHGGSRITLKYHPRNGLTATRTEASSSEPSLAPEPNTKP
ncbi:hypothetical protein JIN77_04515 [Verrucomicrobiaceae bacterium R5-34]|nr:hypothetical protein [Verrucomicrobiaceae bacterium R5-34]